MTFADAIETMQDGEAAKRPSWAGYVKKEVLTTDSESGEPETWAVTFVTRGATSSSAAPAGGGTDALTDDEGTYTYTWDGSEWEAPTDSVTEINALAIDGQLFEALIAHDWEVTTESEAETARTGTGNRW